MAQEDDLLVIELRPEAVAGGYSLLDPNLPNIANYRNVIVDAVSIAELFVDPTSAEAKWAGKRLSHMRAKFAEILSGAARVIVLLPPPTDRAVVYESEPGRKERLTVTNAIGAPLSYVQDPGLKVSTAQDLVKRYFKHIKKVDGHMASSNANLPTGNLADGEYGQALAMRIIAEPGIWLFLPPYKGSAADAIDIVAADILGVPRQRMGWPDWITSAPFQPVQEALAELREAEGQLDTAKQRVQQAEERFERAREPLVLLVETGIECLQKPCERLFKDMGISTEAAPPDVSDEFILRGANVPILVEVKGLEGPATKRHFTQLHADAAKLEELEKSDVKPLLLVNSLRLLPVQEREVGENKPFGKWVEDNAPTYGGALMTTWDLLAVYYATPFNPELPDKLLQTIVKTVGRVDVRKLLRDKGPAASRQNDA